MMLIIVVVMSLRTRINYLEHAANCCISTHLTYIINHLITLVIASGGTWDHYMGYNVITKVIQTEPTETYLFTPFAIRPDLIGTFASYKRWQKYTLWNTSDDSLSARSSNQGDNSSWMAEYNL